jgi:outer membrane receptor protein involved in Fe transport
MIHRSRRLWTAAIFLCTVDAAAEAQVTTPPAATDDPAPPAARELPDTDPTDIIVTATRQSESLSRVPISVSALSQETLDTRSIRSVRDLAREVPALTFASAGVGGSGAGSGTTIAVRGVYATTGAATTGVYLDDIPLQKRFAPGQTASGSPLPQLFDLDRVEVLRGPQGTLFGGSSQGGAVRFITPAPSLTRYSGQSRVEVATTKGGDPSGEIGFALGGPIVTDRLGFRISVLSGTIGGYVDRIDPRTTRLLEEDSNSETHVAVRGALLFVPVDGLQITPSVYVSRQSIKGTDDYWSDVPAFSIPGASYGANGRLASATNPAVFTRATADYPARSYGPGKSGDLLSSPVRNDLFVASLDIGYDFGGFSIKSITGLSIDDTEASVYLPGTVEQLLGRYGGYNILGPDSPGYFVIDNHRRSLSQEIRLSSQPGTRLGWVIGGFYQRATNDASAIGHESLDATTLSLYGVRTAVRYGVQEAAVDPISTYRDETLVETSLAAFGEATFAVTPRLKLIGGARVARETFVFDACQYGTINGTNVCTTTNGLLTSGRQEASPVLPKGGLSYQINDRELVYATVARGYRGGGVNTALPQNTACNASLAALGGSRPQTFDPDYVTSYEVGAKGALFGGRARVNVSAFRIDWSQIQLSIALPGCAGFSYTDNAGTARSQGGDLTASLRLFDWLSADVNMAYTHAIYTETALGAPNASTGARATLVHAGDELPIAPFTVAIGLQYDGRIGATRVYLRGDGQFASAYHKTLGPGAVGYNPDVYTIDETTVVNARGGVRLDRVDLSIFVKNLFDSQDVLNQSTANGRVGCADAACTNPVSRRYSNYLSTYRPRTIGLTAALRY